MVKTVNKSLSKYFLEMSFKEISGKKLDLGIKNELLFRNSSLIYYSFCVSLDSLILKRFRKRLYRRAIVNKMICSNTKETLETRLWIECKHRKMWSLTSFEYICYSFCRTYVFLVLYATNLFIFRKFPNTIIVALVVLF